MTQISAEAGAILFHEGDVADAAYIIRDGSVDIFKHTGQGEVKLATLNTHDVLGELALFEQGVPRSATARAVTDVVLEVITRDEFEQMLNECPPRILPIINMVLDRLRNSNRRLSEKETPTVLLDVDIENIIVTSKNGPALFDPFTLPIARLPLRIGGYVESEGKDKRHRQNHINIACIESPPIVSPQHCQVEIFDGGVHIRDLGSRYTTIVNDQLIGRGKGIYMIPLKKGDNEVRLGGMESDILVNVECK